MTTKQLLERLVSLEKRVEELERRPIYIPYHVTTPYGNIPPWRPYEGPTCPVTQPTWINAGQT